MKVVRFDRLLASTALGIVLVMSGQPARSQPANQTEIVFPLPEELPPPTLKDFGLSEQSVAAPTAVAPKAAEPEKGRRRISARAIPHRRQAPFPTSCVRWLPARPPIACLAGRLTVPALRLSLSARGYKPLWVANGAAAERAKSAIAYLGKADAVGLDPSDYPTPDFNSAITADALASRAEAHRFGPDIRPARPRSAASISPASPPTFSST